jgi:hypothetical protein
MAARRNGDSPRDRIDALYRVPASAFVAARNALSAALRKEGDAESAERVKRLQKPSPGAWALNQVYWRERALYDRLIRAGDGLRRVQQEMLTGRNASPREAMAEREAAVHAVVERAAGFLREDGNPVTAVTRQRLHTTVDAVASYGSAAEGYTPGQMAGDLDAPGFAALASLGGGALRLVHGSKSAPGRADRRQSSAGPPERSATPEALPRGGSRAETLPHGGAPPRDREAERQARKEREAAAKRDAAERARALHAAEQALRDATRELDVARQRAERARAAAESLAREQQRVKEQLAALAERRRAADAASVDASDAVSAAERVRRDAEAALAATRDAARTPR